MAKSAVAGLAAMAVMGTVGAGVANAAGASSGPPFFNTTQASSLDRGSGSDTTVFMMQKIGDLYTTAGLYGCQLVSAASQNLFGGGQSTAANEWQDCQAQSSDIATTDDADNWDRVEVVQGINDVGSGAGQNQLCGAINKPVGLNVDFARSSKPSANIAGCNEQQFGYAKDGVPIVDFPSINPSTYGSSTFAPANVAAAAYPNGAYSTINGGNVGPIAAGWLPGDNPAGTANNGTKLTTVSNLGAESTSVAYRLWCVRGGNQITDWGQLTNLGPNLELEVDATGGSPTVTVDAESGGSVPATVAAMASTSDAVTDAYSDPNTPFTGSTTVSSTTASTITLGENANTSGTYTLIFATGAAKLAVGSGVPVGINVRILAVNTSSGTNYTFGNFADGNTENPASGCESSSTLSDVNGANDPNGATAAAGEGNGVNGHVALENNAHQLELFSQADFPTPDYVDEAIEEAETLYFMSNGVYNTNSYAAESTIDGHNYSANLVGENGVFSGSATELNNSYPTARTLFNITDASTVRESVAGFMNWICDSDSYWTKGTDLNTGLNYDAELSNIITTNYGFPRLSDTTAPVANGTPADNVSAPNDSCVAQIEVTEDGAGNGSIDGAVDPWLGSNFPQDLLTGGTVLGINGSSVPAGTTVAGGQGTNDLTLNVGGGGNLAAGNYDLEFPGIPPVLSASNTP